ncbi:MAG: DUF1460 domain-containing protein [Muribaculaceae bacterium]|nr:DUF1460 domain-containing protein [Muribaculaceae bacterium]
MKSYSADDNISSIAKRYLLTLRYVVTVVICMAAYTPANAIDVLNPTTHCERDTAEITSILLELNSKGKDVSERRVLAAGMLTGRGYDSDVERDSTGTVKLNIHTFTPLSYINTVQALASAAGHDYPTWRDFVREYEKIALRRGEDSGYASVLRYGTDWIADNIYRGNLKELTENYDGAVSKTKSIDYMSRHRDQYAALANPEIYEKIEMIDMGYKQQRIPYLKRQYITRNDVVGGIKDGDIIMMLDNADGLDIYGIFYVMAVDNKLYLTGFNPLTGKTETLPEPADKMFKLMVKNFYGFRWLRWL